jgi:hypothetical protein
VSSLSILLVLLLSQFAGGCNLNLGRVQTFPTSHAKGAAPIIGSPTELHPNPKADVDTSTRDDNDAYEKFYTLIRDHLNREDFDWLESQASDYRANKRRFSGGAWKLHNFYLGLDQPTSAKATEEMWQAHLTKLGKWAANKPQSVTAKLALADAFLEYGWFARGHGYADSVSNEGWRLFDERAARARAILEAANSLDPKCPYWYVLMMELDVSHGSNREQHQKLFQRAIAFEPSYEYFYMSMANYLMPRWHGLEGEWEQFADGVARKVSGKQGSMIYYAIASEIWKSYKNRDFFAETKVSWPKVKQGFADTIETYGSSTRDLNRMALMAGSADDWEFADELLTLIGDNWDTRTWKTRQTFEGYRDFVKKALATSRTQSTQQRSSQSQPFRR